MSVSYTHLKKRILLLGALVGAFLLVSCSGGNKKQVASSATPEELDDASKVINYYCLLYTSYATWCPHCQRMKPVVEEFKKLMEGTIEVVEVDVDQVSYAGNEDTMLHKIPPLPNRH